MGEQDSGQHRAAEQGSEPDRVAAHGVGKQPDRGRRHRVAEQDLAQLALLAPEPAGEEQSRTAPERDRDVGGEDERELTRAREQEIRDQDEAEGEAGDLDRRGAGAVPPVAAREVDRPGEQDPGEEDGRDRARERASRPEGERRRAAPELQRPQRGEAEGDPESEGDLAVGEQRHHAGREPEGRPPRGVTPAIADEAVEEVGGGDHREDADDPRAENRAERREEDAVGEGVVAPVPAAVPDRRGRRRRNSSVRKTWAARSPTWRIPCEHCHRQRRAQRDGRKPVRSE